MLILAALLAAAAPQTQADLSQDAGARARAADAALNTQYRTTMAVMRRLDAGGPAGDGGPTYAAALLAAQRAWLGYRDAECRVEGYAFRGGSAEGMAHAQCIARLTRARTVELRQLARSPMPI